MLFRAGAGDAPVGVYTGEFPLGVVLDIAGVMVYLRLIAVALFLVAGGYRREDNRR